MTFKELNSIFDKSQIALEVGNDLLAEGKSKICLKGMAGSLKSFYASSIYKKTSLPFLFIFEEKEQAAYFSNELEQLISKDDVLFYPGSYRRPYQIEEVDNANILLRAEVLNRLSGREKSPIVVSYADALFEKVITRKELNKHSMKLSVGDSVSIDFLNTLLFEYKFNRVDFVAEPGDFSVRGGIVDVFSFSNDNPYRIEFFGDEVDNIRTFDVENQLSLKKIDTFRIIPNVEDKLVDERRESFLNFISPKTVIYLSDVDVIGKKLDSLHQRAHESFKELKGELRHLKPEELFIDSTGFFDSLAKFKLIQPRRSPYFAIDREYEVHSLGQPSFNKNFELLTQNLRDNSAKGFKNILLCANDKQAQRFHDIFDDIGGEIEYSTLSFPIHEGFVDLDNRIAVYTDHQIFDRYHKFNIKSSHSKSQSVSLKELSNLKIGDFVTHIDHGIGRFGGLQKIDVEGKIQEAIKLVYSDNDLLYVSIHSLHKVSKFNGSDGKVPKINKLGSPAWNNLKKKTKNRVKEIAYDLIQLYAKRRSQRGFQFAPDSYLQHELEASFIYEDTPDQLSATQDVKADMESERPMDRLVCGDVGFGKTEVAIRAAFKAVNDSKQVAILVPTTILAFQHYRTFSQRLKDLPARVDYINRFRNAKDRKQILEDLSNGKIDIIIGTHQLVGEKIKFKDLGLLIIDEEQKFGVAIKDKLKTIKANVDTLTLTATPIPRTLQFSLMAARDLSVINTPPPNRHPIESQVISFDEEIIRDAIDYEISRGGQVFFIHNRIENIREIAGMIQRLVPDAKVAIGHGRMDGKELEKLTLAFINGEFDVLVSTTIVESGIDVANANTMIINNANNFGLSDLHQMRGRVGRSNKKAFCYFIAPPSSAMSEESRKRLEALEQYSGLGQGLNIAMKDLEIRGAGDLLGAEQSGFMADMGFETYQKILNEAIEELKESQFSELFDEVDAKKKKSFKNDCQIDTDFEILFPDDYINNIPERMNLYQELNKIEKEDDLLNFESQISDRFGKMPEQTIDLFSTMRIKWMASSLGFERLVMKKEKMIAYFISDPESSYYKSSTFSGILSFVQNHSQNCRLKERNSKTGEQILTLVFEDITSVSQAMGILVNITQAVES